MSDNGPDDIELPLDLYDEVAASGSQDQAEAKAADKPVGMIYLPVNPGIGVGVFEFVVDPDAHSVEVGTPVRAETTEGPVVGVVVDMRTVGCDTDPVKAELSNRGPEKLAGLDEVIVAEAQVFHSEYVRPVRAGHVYAASGEDLAKATGYDKVDWPIPAGVVKLADGSYAKVCYDGTSLLGREAAHMLVGGLSGQAAKTSYAGVLLKAAIACGDEKEHRVGALVFSVKGTDLLYIDKEPQAGYELQTEDLQMYDALGIPATPFEDVEVWAPGETNGKTRSARAGVLPMRWELKDVWWDLHNLYPALQSDDNLSSLVSQLYEVLVRVRSGDKRSSLSGFIQWWDEEIKKADEDGGRDEIGGVRTHIATARRLLRTLGGVQSKCGDLLDGRGHDKGDISTTGWSHGKVVVVDIAGMRPDVQGLIIARTVKRFLDDAEDGHDLGVDHLAIFADELNTFAPEKGGEMASVRKILQRVATQGRYAGISLWGAGQKLSKVDELVRDNAATRALGITTDGELASGIYGRMPRGLAERIATLPKGHMAVSHYTFRQTLVVKFPRPAWQTGVAKGGSRKPHLIELVDDHLEASSREKLIRGVGAERLEEVVRRDPENAVEILASEMDVDMKDVGLGGGTTFDRNDPFSLE